MKYLLFILLLFAFKVSFAHDMRGVDSFPLTQTFGNGSTLLHSKGGFVGDSGTVLLPFIAVDTNALNARQYSSYNGAVGVTQDSVEWLKYNGAWIRWAGSGSSTIPNLSKVLIAGNSANSSINLTTNGNNTAQLLPAGSGNSTGKLILSDSGYMPGTLYIGRSFINEFPKMSPSDYSLYFPYYNTVTGAHVDDTLLTYKLARGIFGSVASVSTTNGFGILSSVANPATTPNITIGTDTSKIASLFALKDTASSIRSSIGSVVVTVTATGDATGTSTTSLTPSLPLTLATVNSSPGTYGGASTAVSVTVNAKGLVTNIATPQIQIVENQVTNLTSDLASKKNISDTGLASGYTTRRQTDSAIASKGYLTAAVSKLNDSTTNGVGVHWVNPTTTPAPVVTLGNIAPTSVTTNYVNLARQYSATPPPPNGNEIFDSAGLSWRDSLGTTVIISKANVTKGSIVKLSVQNKSYTIGDSADIANINPTVYGTIFNANTFSNLSAFTTNGTTPTISGTAIQFTGGVQNASQTLDYNYYTCIEKYSMTIQAVVGTKTSTSTGIGPGIRSYNHWAQYNNVFANVDLRTGGTSGQLVIDAGSTASPVTVATSTTNLTITAGDTVVTTLIRNGAVVTAIAYDKTTNSAPITVSYTFPLSYPVTVGMQNTGKFAIYNFGGTQLLDSISITSTEKVNNTVMFVGDSKTAGYYQGTFSNRFASLFGAYYSTEVNAGASDQTFDVINRLPEIIALRPKLVILNIGRNDIAQGISSSVYNANYDTIVNTLNRNGIPVINLLPLYETVVNQAPLISHIVATYPNTYVDARGVDWSATPSTILVADNIHPDSLFATKIVAALLNSTFFKNVIPVNYSNGTPWLQAGNSGTNSQYIGTNDLNPFIIATNGVPRVNVLSNSASVGIGSTPLANSNLTVVATSAAEGGIDIVPSSSSTSCGVGLDSISVSGAKVRKGFLGVALATNNYSFNSAMGDILCGVAGPSEGGNGRLILTNLAAKSILFCTASSINKDTIRYGITYTGMGFYGNSSDSASKPDANLYVSSRGNKGLVLPSFLFQFYPSIVGAEDGLMTYNIGTHKTTVYNSGISKHVPLLDSTSLTAGTNVSLTPSVGGSIAIAMNSSPTITKLNITTGSNATVGTATLSGGTVTVSTTTVTASSKIFLTDATTGALTNVGSLTVGTITAGTSFVINSTNVLDASNVNWLIIN